MKFIKFGDSTSRTVQDKLKTICMKGIGRLSRIAILNFRVNERGSNSADSIV